MCRLSWFSSGAADACLADFVKEPQRVPGRAFASWPPSSEFLDLLPQAPLPPMQNRDAQHKFLQHHAKGVFSLEESLESLKSLDPLFSTVWGFSKISRISKFSGVSRKWTFLKRPLFQKTPFSEPDQGAHKPKFHVERMSHE